MLVPRGADDAASSMLVPRGAGLLLIPTGEQCGHIASLHRTNAASLVVFHWSLSLEVPGYYLAEVKDTSSHSLSKSPLGRENDVQAEVAKTPVI